MHVIYTYLSNLIRIIYINLTNIKYQIINKKYIIIPTLQKTKYHPTPKMSAKTKQNTRIKLCPITDYTQLPDSSPIKQFWEKLQKKVKVSDLSKISAVYLEVEDIKTAYLTIAFCFGGLKVLSTLSQNSMIKEQSIKKCKQMFNKFVWNENLSPSQIYQINSKEFSHNYPTLYTNIFQYLNEQDSEQIFQSMKQTSLLYAVKIRFWAVGSAYSNQKVMRKYQKNQLNKRSDLTYLLITKTKYDRYLVSLLFQNVEMDVSDSISYNIQGHSQNDVDFKEEEDKNQGKIDKNRKSVAKSQSNKSHRDSLNIQSQPNNKEISNGDYRRLDDLNRPKQKTCMDKFCSII